MIAGKLTTSPVCAAKSLMNSEQHLPQQAIFLPPTRCRMMVAEFAQNSDLPAATEFWRVQLRRRHEITGKSRCKLTWMLRWAMRTIRPLFWHGKLLPRQHLHPSSARPASRPVFFFILELPRHVRTRKSVIVCTCACAFGASVVRALGRRASCSGSLSATSNQLDSDHADQRLVPLAH